MGEIKDFINIYISESGLIENSLSEIASNLTANIQNELKPKHGYLSGDLHDSIQSNIKKNNLGGVIEAYTMIKYAPWVNDGHTLRNDEWWKGYQFMEQGLEKTVAMYR